MARKRYYVGLMSDNRREVFASEVTPKQDTCQYLAVIGPFRRKGAATLMAVYGANNPHMQSVSDAERLYDTGMRGGLIW